MFRETILKSASLLYRSSYPLYRLMYFSYKNKKDKHHLQLIRKIVKPGNVVLDIGANVGFYSVFFSETAGENGRIYSFEPDPENFRHLKKEIGNQRNVTAIQKAIGSKTGTTTLYTSRLLNVDHRSYATDDYLGKLQAEQISVDDFVDGKFKVDFIKMDIQGFEAEVFRGMKKTIAANNNVMLFSEFWPYGLQQAGSSAAEFFQLISDEGFIVYQTRRGDLVKMTREEAEKMEVEYFTDANVLLSKNELSLNL